MSQAGDDRWKTTQWDAIVIGGGHNGLVAAAYMARAGQRVLVLERRDIVGGAAVTEELHPGFKYSRAAYVVSLLRPRIVRELGLHKHGFSMIPRNPSSFTPLLDARSLLLGPDPKLNHREVAKFSRRDAQMLPRYEAMLNRFTRVVEPLLDRAPPDPFATTAMERATAWIELLRHGLRTLGLGRDLLPFIEILTAPARRILERWFESEPLLATLATDSIIGAMAGPSTPGSGYVLLHHVMGETDGVRGVWGYVRGGMGSLSEAIAGAARAFGARIETGQTVKEIVLRHDRADGVVLEDGTELHARTVLSNADPRTTFRKLLPDDSLPDGFRRHIDSLDFSSGVTKINLALDRLPDFRACPGDSPGPQHRGTIHFTSTIDEIEAAYRDALAGKSSARPVIEMTIPSSIDDTLAPAGQHVASLFVQYTPCTLDDGSWDDPGRKERFADRVLELIEGYAPGFTASVLHRDVLSPLDLERIFGLTGGNIFHGAMSPDQLFWLRPAPGWSRYHTPVRGLYLCGAGAHPGGGVLGAPGRNAAMVAIRDARR